MCFQQSRCILSLVEKGEMGGRAGREAQTKVHWINLKVHYSIGSICFTAFFSACLASSCGMATKVPSLLAGHARELSLSHSRCWFGGMLPHSHAAA